MRRGEIYPTGLRVDIFTRTDRMQGIEVLVEHTCVCDDGCGEPASIESSAGHSDQFAETAEGHAGVRYHRFSFRISESSRW